LAGEGLVQQGFFQVIERVAFLLVKGFEVQDFDG
jgi:hypothetical protein